MNDMPATPLHDTAATLVRIAWEADHARNFVAYSMEYRKDIALSIDYAHDIYVDRFRAEPTDYDMQRARLLLELETNALIRAQERDREAAEQDARDAGYELGGMD